MKMLFLLVEQPRFAAASGEVQPEELYARAHQPHSQPDARRSRRVLGAVLSSLTVHQERMMAASGNGFATATELADTLVRRCGLPFRTEA